jgi:hypothetical protein
VLFAMGRVVLMASCKGWRLGRPLGEERRRGCRVPTTPERGGAPAAAGDEHRWELRLPAAVRPVRSCHRRGVDGRPLTRAGTLAARKRPRGVVAAGTMHYAVAFGKPPTPARVGGCRRAARPSPCGSTTPLPCASFQGRAAVPSWGGVRWWSSWWWGVGPVCTRGGGGRSAPRPATAYKPFAARGK